METTVINATEYRNVSLSLLNESKSNPRRNLRAEVALKELAESIRSQGVSLARCLVRPLTENGFEIVAGATSLSCRADGRNRAPCLFVLSTSPMPQAVEMSQLVENLHSVKDDSPAGGGAGISVPC